MKQQRNDSIEPFSKRSKNIRDTEETPSKDKTADSADTTNENESASTIIPGK